MTKFPISFRNIVKITIWKKYFFTYYLGWLYRLNGLYDRFQTLLPLNFLTGVFVAKMLAIWL